MKKKIIQKYIVCFKHPRGWTYLETFNNANDARIFIRKQSLPNWQYCIRPADLIIYLTDKLAPNFIE